MPIHYKNARKAQNTKEIQLIKRAPMTSLQLTYLNGESFPPNI